MDKGQIRKARLKDVLRIVKLHSYLIKHLHSVNPRMYTESADKSEQKRFEKNLKKYLKDKNSLVLVYEINNKINGYAISRIKEYPSFISFRKYGEIHEVVVSKDMQEKGIGSKFVKKIISFFKSRKVKIAELLIDSRNLAGLKAWSKAGFKEELKIMKKFI